jgi:serine phosphatase RsbU (regulator of sigma subunit)
VDVRVAVDPVDERSGESVDASVPTPVPGEAAAGERIPRRRGHRPGFNVAVVAVVGVIITAGLSAGAYALHNSNENRLLNQRVREIGVVITAAIPTIQTPLASAEVLAESTGGDQAAFRKFVTPLVTPSGETPATFTSVSLWRASGDVQRPLIVVGDQLSLARENQAGIRDVLERAGNGTLAINNLLAASDRRLGFAYESASPGAQYVVYAESPRPQQRRATVERDNDEAFAELNYAFYLGDTTNPKYLLASSTGGAILHGRRTSTNVKFGDSNLLVVMTPRTELGGTLLSQLWWLLSLLGLALTFGAATLVGRLSRRRLDAEVLATENAGLYAEQRSVAQTLQHSLLAEAFPDIGGLEFAARYVAGVEGIDIGGDWYDVVRLDHGNILIVVGDVSGRGLGAATMMASLRFSVRAYAVEGYSPATILTKLSGLASVARDGHFATVLCALLDVGTGRVTVANAGHPAPLLVSPAGSEFVETSIGVPVGVRRGSPYSEVEFMFPRGSTLLVYTDGAVERRGERLDTGMQRLADAASASDGSLDQMLDAIIGRVLPAGADDDTALLGVRWTT